MTTDNTKFTDEQYQKYFVKNIPHNKKTNMTIEHKERFIEKMIEAENILELNRVNNTSYPEEIFNKHTVHCPNMNGWDLQHITLLSVEDKERFIEKMIEA